MDEIKFAYREKFDYINLDRYITLAYETGFGMRWEYNVLIRAKHNIPQGIILY